MITYKIHLIRHAAIEPGRAGQYIGRTDLPVSEEGMVQLEQLREDAEYPRVDVVYSGPLLRCRQTAGALYPGRHITLMDDLTELDFGEFEGKTFEELSGDPAFGQWMGNSFECAPPGGETMHDFLVRITRALGRIFQDMMNRRMTSAAVITHGGVIMTLCSALGLPKAEMHEWMTPNGTGYTLLMTPQMWMRDHCFEVYDLIPRRPEDRERREELQRLAYDLMEEDPDLDPLE